MSQNLESSTDEKLMSMIVRGDKQAFNKFLLRHLQSIVSFSSRYANDFSAAEDIAQEAFTRVWVKAESWTSKGVSPLSWVYRITYNLCIDYLRNKRGQVNTKSSEPIDVSLTPEEQLISNDKTKLLNESLMQLPERQRSAIMLCAYQGLSNIEAASVLDCSVEALESLLSRGRRTLKKKMESD